MAERSRRGVDLLLLVAGLLTLGGAGGALLDAVPGAPTFDIRWVLAAGAAIVGVALLAGALSSRRS